MSFPDILQWLSMGGKTGTLKINLPQDQYRLVYFKNGNVVAARTSLLRDHLGKVLVREEKINKEQLRIALERQKQDKLPFGQVCVALGFITDEELIEVLRAHSEGVIYSLFSLTEGEFIFNEEPIPEDQLIPITLGANDLLMKGIKLRNEWEKVQRKVGGLNTVFAVISEIDVSVLGLARNDEEIMRLIDGRRNIADVCEKSPVSDFETYRALYKFQDDGYISKVDVAKLDALAEESNHQVDILAEAQELVNQKNHGEAIKALKSFLELFPDHSEAKALLVKCQRAHIEDIFNTVGTEKNIPKLNVPLTDPVFQKMALTSQEGFLLSRMDGTANVKNLSNMTRIPIEDVYRILHQLVQKKVIQIIDPAKTAGPAQGAASRGVAPGGPPNPAPRQSPPNAGTRIPVTPVQEKKKFR